MIMMIIIMLYLEAISMDRRTILKYISKEYHVKTWTGLISLYLRIRSKCGLL
jgi:hypothetical protein